MAYVPETINEIKKNKLSSFGVNRLNIFWSLAWIILLILLLLKLFVYQQVTVIGESMEPNYQTGQLLLVDQINRSYSRGQVVAVYADKEVARTADYWTRFQARFFLKRVIGLPGEEIEIAGHNVIIYNSEYPEGRVLAEDYIDERVKNKEDLLNYYFPKTLIPAKNYFVLGDNRANSLDSREKGFFPDYSLFGQETIRFWPLREAQTFTLPKYKYETISPEIKSQLLNLRKTQSRDDFAY